MSLKVIQLVVALVLVMGPCGTLPALSTAPVFPSATEASPPARGPVAAFGVETGAGWLPALGMYPALPAAHDLTMINAGLRVRFSRPAADWVLRLSVLDLQLQEGNYLGRGSGWDDAQFVWFDTTRFYYVQLNRERIFARSGDWRWSWSAGAGLGVLSGRMVLQNAQGCRASNWRHADTDPAWGGCYHDPDPYGSSRVDFPPVMGFLHAAIGLSRRYGTAAFHAEAGFFLPGFFGFSIAVEMDSPR